MMTEILRRSMRSMAAIFRYGRRQCQRCQQDPSGENLHREDDRVLAI